MDFCHRRLNSVDCYEPGTHEVNSIMRKVTTSLAATFFLALPIAFAPNGVSAQDVEAPQMCTASVQPAAITAGEAAVHLVATLSEDIGSVTGIQSAESGIAVASPEELPRTEMSTDAEAPKAIAMTAEGNTVGLWLNTLGAEAGTFQVVLEGESGMCHAEVTVTPAG